MQAADSEEDTVLDLESECDTEGIVRVVDQKEVDYLDISAPKLAADYNEHMGAVDNVDRVRELLTIRYSAVQQEVGSHNMAGPPGYVPQQHLHTLPDPQS